MSESETPSEFEIYVQTTEKLAMSWEQAIADEVEKKAIFKEQCMEKIKKLTDIRHSLARTWTEISAASLRLEASIKPNGYLAEYTDLCE
jgi:predicted transposase YbfD/YdcC